MTTVKGIDPKMIANNLEPYEPTHPGELLKDEIECRGLSQKQLAAGYGRVLYCLERHCELQTTRKHEICAFVRKSNGNPGLYAFAAASRL